MNRLHEIRMTNIDKNIPVNIYSTEFKPGLENYAIIGLSSQEGMTFFRLLVQIG